MVSPSTGLEALKGAAETAGDYLDPATRALEPVGEFLGDAMEKACNWYGNNPDNLLRKSPLHAGLLGGICAPYFTANNYDAPRPAVIGGQCDTLYDIKRRVKYTLRSCANDSVVSEIDQELSTITGQPGPITSIGKFVEEFNSCGGTRLSEIRVGVQNANGGIFGIGVNDQASSGRYITNFSGQFEAVRSDGQPDNCGDDGLIPGENPPPPWQMGEEYPPPGLPPGSPPATIFEPEININGDINLRVCIASVCVNLLGPGVGGDVNVPPPKSDRPKESGPPLNPEDLGDGENEGDLPPPPAGFEYQAIEVEIINDSALQPPIPGTAPADVFPNTLGNVSLNLQAEDGEVVVSASVRQRCRRAVYVRPDEGLTIKGVYVSLTPNSTSYVLTPILVPVEASDNG